MSKKSRKQSKLVHNSPAPASTSKPCRDDAKYNGRDLKDAIQQSTPARLVRKVWKGVGIVALLLGLIGNSYFRFRSEVVVTPTVSIDEENPFSQQIRILNNGILPIQIGRASCRERV